MASLSGRNLPPPQSPFVNAPSKDNPSQSYTLSFDGYQFLLNLLTNALSGLTQQTVASQVGASGANQATAFQLESQWNVVTNTASGSGVLLSSLLPGQSILVFNASGVGISVYPPPGFQIDISFANMAYPLASTKMQIFFFVSDSQIYSTQLG